MFPDFVRSDWISSAETYFIYNLQQAYKTHAKNQRDDKHVSYAY